MYTALRKQIIMYCGLFHNQFFYLLFVCIDFFEFFFDLLIHCFVPFFFFVFYFCSCVPLCHYPLLPQSVIFQFVCHTHLHMSPVPSVTAAVTLLIRPNPYTGSRLAFIHSSGVQCWFSGHMCLLVLLLVFVSFAAMLFLLNCNKV